MGKNVGIRSLQGDVIALDVETDGLDPYHGARIFCWSYFTNAGEYGFMRKTPEGIAWIKRLFEDPTKKIVFHNAKFDLKMFFMEGIDIFNSKAQFHCTLILSKLFNAMLWSYELKHLAAKFLNRSTADKTEITDWLKANKRVFKLQHGRDPNFSDAPIDLVKKRALWDTESTLRLFYRFYKPVMEASAALYENERDLMLVCVDMEDRGIEVDITRAKELKAEAEAGITRIYKDLKNLVGDITIKRAHCTVKGCKRKRGKGIKVVILPEDIPDSCPVCGGEIEIKETIVPSDGFNANSAAIHLPLAFAKLGIELKYKTKAKKGKKGKKGSGGGKWCFDEYAMIRYVSPQLAAIIRESSEDGWPASKFYAQIHQAIREHSLSRSELLPPLILKVRELEKMVTTYYDHLIQDCVNVRVEPSGREVGVLHCKFNQSEAMTGRFSSSEPNMQNMPRILGPRECFIPRRGRRHWHIDYSQVEMKLFVHFAEDEKMAKAIEGDIHHEVAAEIYGLPRDKVSKEQRKRAKGVNFGIIYGSGAGTMAETLTKKGLLTTKAEASKLVANYHRRFPSVRRTTNKLKAQLQRFGYVTNPFGRRYHIDKQKAYKALNYLCQGTSADLMKFALVRIWKWLRANNLKSRILLTIHDELCLEIPQNEEEMVVNKCYELMEDKTSFYVPITVDADIVKHRWSEKYSPESDIAQVNHKKHIHIPWWHKN